MDKDTLIDLMAEAHWNSQVDEYNRWHELDGDEREEATKPMRAAFEALSSSGYMVVEGWKPIETAPKDGIVIDLHHSKYGRIRSVFWEADDEFWIAEDEDPFITHWIPLPPPPQAQVSDEERSDEVEPASNSASLTP
jgi:hypothetical protein